MILNKIKLSLPWLLKLITITFIFNTEEELTEEDMSSRFGKNLGSVKSRIQAQESRKENNDGGNKEYEKRWANIFIKILTFLKCRLDLDIQWSYCVLNL